MKTNSSLTIEDSNRSDHCNHIHSKIPSSSKNKIAQFFEENGYYIAKGVFSEKELFLLGRDFDRIINQLEGSGENIYGAWKGSEMQRLGGENTQIIHTHNVQKYSAEWMKAFYQEKFLDFAEQIIGPDIVLHHSKLFQKPPEKGSPFPMHQDWTYFPTIKDTMIAGIIHVTEATDEMGCLRVYPGSHRLGRIQKSHGQGENETLSQYPLEKAIPLEAEPGDVVFFHYFTLHGSMPNKSPRVRKTVLIQLHSGNDHVEEQNRHSNEKLVLRGWNSYATRNTVNQGKA